MAAAAASCTGLGSPDGACPTRLRERMRTAGAAPRRCVLLADGTRSVKPNRLRGSYVPSISTGLYRGHGTFPIMSTLIPFIWDRPLEDPAKIIGMEGFAREV